MSKNWPMPGRIWMRLPRRRHDLKWNTLLTRQILANGKTSKLNFNCHVAHCNGILFFLNQKKNRSIPCQQELDGDTCKNVCPSVRSFVCPSPISFWQVSTEIIQLINFKLGTVDAFITWCAVHCFSSVHCTQCIVQI